MSLPIFPFSPLPANLQRQQNWGENVVTYDSGATQGESPFLRPLYIWTVPIKLMTEIKAGSLWSFNYATKGMTKPFLVKDAYDFAVTSVLAAGSATINASTLYLFDTNSFFVRADTTTVGSLFSAMSGYVSNGVEYAYDQDTGLLTVNTKALNDVWGVRSMTYYRKARMSQSYKETSQLWNIFASEVDMVELP